MRKKRSDRIRLFLILLLLVILGWIMIRSCRSPREEREAGAPPVETKRGESLVLATTNLNLDFSKHKVTFIELGADRCIPCQAMQPIMRDIAQEYAGRIQVVFYDVWKDPRPARHYGIQLIPTQVFIDQSGGEIFRHVGLFPKAEILHMLKAKGVL